MARTKPKYGYSEPTSTAPELSEKFQNKITGIIDTTPKQTLVFLDNLRTQLHRYDLRKKNRRSVDGIRPTIAQEMSNGRDLKKTVERLIEQLTGEAGGLKHYLNNGIANLTNSYPPNMDTQHLIQILQGVEYGCDDFLGTIEDDFGPRYEPRVPAKDDPVERLSPLAGFVYEIAKAIRDILGETPKAYIYLGKNPDLPIGGKFAEILDACISEVERGVERDLRSLMKDALETLKE